MKKTCIAILAGATLLTPAFLPQAAPAAQARSLWSDDGTTYTQNIFADRKARNVGDIVTIIISETTTRIRKSHPPILRRRSNCSSHCQGRYVRRRLF